MRVYVCIYARDKERDRRKKETKRTDELIPQEQGMKRTTVRTKRIVPVESKILAGRTKTEGKSIEREKRKKKRVDELETYPVGRYIVFSIGTYPSFSCPLSRNMARCGRVARRQIIENSSILRKLARSRTQTCAFAFPTRKERREGERERKKK